MRQDGDLNHPGIVLKSESAWMIGKNTYEIDFVIEAENYLLNNEDRELQNAVGKVKSGTTAINGPLPVALYLETKFF